jgi:hypothetical protein
MAFVQGRNMLWTWKSTWNKKTRTIFVANEGSSSALIWDTTPAEPLYVLTQLCNTLKVNSELWRLILISLHNVRQLISSFAVQP